MYNIVDIYLYIIKVFQILGPTYAKDNCLKLVLECGILCVTCVIFMCGYLQDKHIMKYIWQHTPIMFEH